MTLYIAIVLGVVGSMLVACAAVVIVAAIAQLRHLHRLRKTQADMRATLERRVAEQRDLALWEQEVAR